MSCARQAKFGIRVAVRFQESQRPFVARQIGALLWAGQLLLLLTGCSSLSRADQLGTGYYLPLTVQLRMAPAVAEAQVTYLDACGQSRILPIGSALQEAITRKAGRVFEKVVTEGMGVQAVDGYQDVSVGLIDLETSILRKVNRSYPATLSIGLDFAYTDADGTVLYSKKLQSFGKGDVEVTDSSCEVKGLEQLAQEAIANVTDGMAKQLGTSNKILDAAGSRRSGTARAATTTSVPPPALPAETLPGPASVRPQANGVVSLDGPRPGETATLVFRAIIRDENRNQLLHPGELISLEIEVKNEGSGDAAGVEVLVSGTPELVERLPGTLSVGDIASGDVKRVSVEGKVGMVKEAKQAELILALRTGSTPVEFPSVKKFFIAMKPGTDGNDAGLSVDVDEPPKRPGKFTQPKAIGVAIGVGQFREGGLLRGKYAARDAEIMAKYWQAVGGVPSDRIRRLIDTGALKGDLVETFEEWLPKLADPSTVVYVYVSGRGVVETATGAVSIIPFDGTAQTGARLYSLRRLQDALTKLPIHRAIVMLDLSLEPVPGQGGVDQITPLWEEEGADKDKVMWMIGNRAVQEAHQYDLGQHGLFTFELLKGLAGAADLDRDETISAGELCTYAKGQVITRAREQFGNEQAPLCIPGPGQGAMIRLQPLAKLK